MFFQPFDGYGEYVRRRGDFTSPSGRTSAELDHMLQRRLAFLDSNYRLSVVAHRLDPDFRAGVEGPKHDIWKLSECRRAAPDVACGRGSKHDPQAARPHALGVEGLQGEISLHARADRQGPRSAPRRRSTRSARAAAKWCSSARLRPPSCGSTRKRRCPRRRDGTRCFAIRAARACTSTSLTQAQDLILPEWSHLNRKCATVFTDAYVRRLAELTPRLKLQNTAPGPLTRADCVPQAVAKENERPVPISSLRRKRPSVPRAGTFPPASA